MHFTFIRILASLIAVSLISVSDMFAEDKKEQGMDQQEYMLRPIGKVSKVDGKSLLILNKDVESGLLGLDDFSHVLVFWWFDKNDTPQKRRILQVHPRGDRENPLTGVFACRSPVRPNLLALTTCKIISIKDNIVEIEDIDAFDGTPVLDLKGYIPALDSVKDAKAPARRFKKK